MTLIPRRNNEATKSLKLSEIAKLAQGELAGDPELIITGVAGIQEAQKGDITFLSNVRYLPFLRESQASAVIASEKIETSGKALILTSDPSKAFSKIISFFISEEKKPEAGVHASAIVGRGAHLGAGVSVGAHCVIEDDVILSEGVIVGPQCFIGRGVCIGAHSRLYPQVVLREGVEIGARVIIHSGSVIGSDGFGYETFNGKHLKIPQVGSVTIEDDVEIGSNVCVDRGRFQNTRVCRGSKIDNLVQIAHNVVIGEDCMVISQVGISGSTRLGKNVVIAGQAGLVGHLTIGDEAIIGARAGVSKSVPEKTIVLGEPARPINEQKRLFALISRLPEMFKDLSELKKKLQ